MTTTVSPPIQEAPVHTGAGRVMQTPEIEPLTVAPEDQARNVVDLIHRAVERYPTARRCAGSCRSRGAPRAPTEADWTSRTYREMWDWVTDAFAGSQGPRHLATATASASSAAPGPNGRSATSRRWRCGAVTCPIYPQSEAGQAAFVINNVGAKAIFVENAQQAAKIASIRADCPTHRACHQLRGERQAAARDAHHR